MTTSRPCADPRTRRVAIHPGVCYSVINNKRDIYRKGNEMNSVITDTVNNVVSTFMKDFNTENWPGVHAESIFNVETKRIEWTVHFDGNQLVKLMAAISIESKWVALDLYVVPREGEPVLVVGELIHETEWKTVDSKAGQFALRTMNMAIALRR